MGATKEIMGAANDGAWPDMQIRQTVEDAGADRVVEKLGAVRSDTNSQLSKACAMVVITSRPMHSEAHEASTLLAAADLRWLLVISRKTR